MHKKLTVITLLGCSLFSATSFATNIDITGTVVASPCAINGGQASLAVKLGDSIQADSLATAGSATEWKDFTLELSGCPASTSSFSVTFSGTADTDTDFYKNTGNATNLKLELVSKTGDTRYSNGESLNNVTIPSTHAYSLPLRTRAVSKGNVMPGTIEGQVQATFTWQ